jgi:hypothetical protein
MAAYCGTSVAPSLARIGAPFIRPMRTVSSFLGGAIVSIAAFSIFWSLFIVKQHSYGGDSRLSQIEGTFVFFMIYLFPFLVGAVLLFVLPTELMFTRKKPLGARCAIRWVNWGIVAACGLAIPAALTTPDLALAAAICGLMAATIGGFVYGRIAAEAPSPAGR